MGRISVNVLVPTTIAKCMAHEWAHVSAYVSVLMTIEMYGTRIDFVP